MPRRVGRVRGIEILLIIAKAGVIVLILPSIVLTYAPRGISVREQAFNALFLFLLADVQKYFYQQIAVVNQLAFKGVDRLVGLQ